MTPDAADLQALNGARDQLFMWMVAVQDQARRVTVEAQYDHNIEVDCALYAVALRNLLRVANLARRFDHAVTQAAFDEFKEAVPGIVDIRNVLEHFDAYEVGDGDLQKAGKLPPIISIWWESTDDNNVILNLSGGYRLDVRAATEAASRFGRVLADVLKG